MDKNKHSSRVSTRGALKRQAHDFMIEFGSGLGVIGGFSRAGAFSHLDSLLCFTFLD